MFHYTDLTGLASVAAALAAATLLLPPVARLHKARQALLSGIIFVFMLIPLGDLSLAAYVRGATGDLSITSLVLMVCASTTLWCGPHGGRRQSVLLLIALAALALYPMALGATIFDPYRLGYGDTQFIIALLLLALVAWIWKHYLLALCISFAVLAWAIGWYESDNMWDYLLDPFVAIFALLTIVTRTAKSLLPRSSAQKTQATLPG